jgi:hypothetical protein
VDKHHPLNCVEAYGLIQEINAVYSDKNVKIRGLLLPFLSPAVPKSERPYSSNLQISSLQISYSQLSIIQGTDEGKGHR